MTKPIKWHVRTAKIQISLGIYPIWSEPSLSAWRKVESLATHLAHSKDSDQTAYAQADLSLRWTHMTFCWFCHALAQIVPFLIYMYKQLKADEYTFRGSNSN